MDRVEAAEAEVAQEDLEWMGHEGGCSIHTATALEMSAGFPLIPVRGTGRLAEALVEGKLDWRVTEYRVAEKCMQLPGVYAAAVYGCCP